MTDGDHMSDQDARRIRKRTLRLGLLAIGFGLAALIVIVGLIVYTAMLALGGAN